MAQFNRNNHYRNRNTVQCKGYSAKENGRCISMTTNGILCTAHYNLRRDLERRGQPFRYFDSHVGDGKNVEDITNHTHIPSTRKATVRPSQSRNTTSTNNTPLGVRVCQQNSTEHYDASSGAVIEGTTFDKIYAPPFGVQGPITKLAWIVNTLLRSDNTLCFFYIQKDETYSPDIVMNCLRHDEEEGIVTIISSSYNDLPSENEDVEETEESDEETEDDDKSGDSQNEEFVDNSDHLYEKIIEMIERGYKFYVWDCEKGTISRIL